MAKKPTKQGKTPNPVGRPRKYKNAVELQTAVDAVFKKWEEDKTPYTISGLAYDLDFADRQSLIDYAKDGEFSCTIKKAKSRVEVYIEQSLYGTSVAGPIFNLKNNFGWKDKVEQDVNLSGKVDTKWTVEFVNATPKTE